MSLQQADPHCECNGQVLKSWFHCHGWVFGVGPLQSSRSETLKSVVMPSMWVRCMARVWAPTECAAAHILGTHERELVSQSRGRQHSRHERAGFRADGCWVYGAASMARFCGRRYPRCGAYHGCCWYGAVSNGGRPSACRSGHYREPGRCCCEQASAAADGADHRQRCAAARGAASNGVAG